MLGTVTCLLVDQKLTLLSLNLLLNLLGRLHILLFVGVHPLELGLLLLLELLLEHIIEVVGLLQRAWRRFWICLHDLLGFYVVARHR